MLAKTFIISQLKIQKKILKIRFWREETHKNLIFKICTKHPVSLQSYHYIHLYFDSKYTLICKTKLHSSKTFCFIHKAACNVSFYLNKKCIIKYNNIKYITLSVMLYLYTSIYTIYLLKFCV